jgi:hypothetical protein
MIATKGKVLAALAFLFLASSITMANASQARTEFYLEAPNCSMVGEPWVNVADGVAMIMKYTVEGVVETCEHVEVGTIHMDVVTIIGARVPGTFSARFVIDFGSGKTVEGTITGTQIITNVGVDVEGRFVGHGDMHVMGSVNDIDGQPGTLILDGYSW